MTTLKIDYIEFHTTALAGSKGFFAGAFGWTSVDYGPNYAGFEGAGMDGGFDASVERAEAGALRPPLIILKADNLEAAEKAVVAAGGEIVRPAYGFPGGRRFHFREPGGNELAVWSER